MLQVLTGKQGLNIDGIPRRSGQVCLSVRIVVRIYPIKKRSFKGGAMLLLLLLVLLLRSTRPKKETGIRFEVRAKGELF